MAHEGRGDGAKVFFEGCIFESGCSLYIGSPTGEIHGLDSCQGTVTVNGSARQLASSRAPPPPPTPPYVVGVPPATHSRYAIAAPDVLQNLNVDTGGRRDALVIAGIGSSDKPTAPYIEWGWLSMNAQLAGMSGYGATAEQLVAMQAQGETWSRLGLAVEEDIADDGGVPAPTVRLGKGPPVNEQLLRAVKPQMRTPPALFAVSPKTSSAKKPSVKKSSTQAATAQEPLASQVTEGKTHRQGGCCGCRSSSPPPVR